MLRTCFSVTFILEEEHHTPSSVKGRITAGILTFVGRNEQSCLMNEEAAGDQKFKIINNLHHEPFSITDVYFFFYSIVN